MNAVSRTRTVSGETSRQRASNSVPSHPGHPLVADHEGDGLVGEQVERRLRPLRAEHAVVHGEQRLERVEDPRLVVDDEDRRLGRHAGAAGRWGGARVNTAPPPAGLSARISPPCFLTIS